MQSIKSKLRTDSMKYFSLAIALCGSLAMFVSGCKNSTDLASPQIVTVPKDFTVTPGSLTHSQFAANGSNIFFSGPGSPNVDDTITATLSSAVTWNVDILGLTSGAKKRITGLSSTVQAAWNGGHDGIMFFKPQEQVLVTLSFYGTDMTVTDTLTIVAVRKYNDVQDGNHRGYLVSDFEVPTVLPPNPPGGAWFNFHDPTGSAGIAGPDAEQDSNKVTSFLNAVQGYQCFYFEGTDRTALNSNYSTFFIMGAGFSQPGPILDSIKKDVGTINPDDLYFNVYVYGFGLPNSKFQVGFDEDENGDKTWTSTTEDELVYIVRVDWTGWKLVTFKYTDTKFSNVDPNGGAHGNRIREPEKIVKMGFVMNTDPALMHAKVAWDYPCFTYGHPFNPNN